MSNKTQSMLTIALTFAVTVLVTDRMIEPAQAQNCASSYDVQRHADRVIERVLTCVGGMYIYNTDAEYHYIAYNNSRNCP